jgi:hypothetical protein
VATIDIVVQPAIAGATGVGAAPHALLLQVDVAAQALPHMPQFAGSSFMSTQPTVGQTSGVSVWHMQTPLCGNAPGTHLQGLVVIVAEFCVHVADAPPEPPPPVEPPEPAVEPPADEPPADEPEAPAVPVPLALLLQPVVLAATIAVPISKIARDKLSLVIRRRLR